MTLSPKINLSTITALLLAAASTAVAFGAPITAAQTAGLLVLGDGLAAVLLLHGLSGALSFMTPQTLVGLVSAILGVAASFGLHITAHESSELLTLTGLVAGLLLTHGMVAHVAQIHKSVALPSDTEEQESQPSNVTAAVSLSGVTGAQLPSVQPVVEAPAPAAA